ncbi:hypothetical protein Hanom_Chr16g01434421 [Helianthus anomalus]
MFLNTNAKLDIIAPIKPETHQPVRNENINLYFTQKTCKKPILLQCSSYEITNHVEVELSKGGNTSSTSRLFKPTKQ